MNRTSAFNKPIYIDRDPILGMYCDEATVNVETHLHFTTNTSVNHLYMYADETEIAHWTEADATEVTTYDMYKEWTVPFTFDTEGLWGVYYKASTDGETLSSAFNSERDGIFDIVVAPGESETEEFEYEVIDGGASLKKYNGTASAVVVPQTVTIDEVEYTVIKIGDSAFENNAQLVSIDLPDTIQVIGARAFKNCTSLSSMS